MHVAPGADRPPAAARAPAEYIVRLLPPIVLLNWWIGAVLPF